MPFSTRRCIRRGALAAIAAADLLNVDLVYLYFKELLDRFCDLDFAGASRNLKVYFLFCEPVMLFSVITGAKMIS